MLMPACILLVCEPLFRRRIVLKDMQCVTWEVEVEEMAAKEEGGLGEMMQKRMGVWREVREGRESLRASHYKSVSTCCTNNSSPR
jgi:hypothetical protein